jgi:hypothetical protein
MVAGGTLARRAEGGYNAGDEGGVTTWRPDKQEFAVSLSNRRVALFLQGRNSATFAAFRGRQ